MSALTSLPSRGFPPPLPLLVGDDDDHGEIIADQETPVQPDPVVIDGTESAGTLTAQTDQIVNGFGGGDILATAADSDNTILKGGAGDDRLELFGTSAIARGGLGDDEILSIDIHNGVAEGSEGNDEITFRPLRPADALAEDDPISTSRADGGAGDDTILLDSSRTGGGTPLLGGEGNDLIANYSRESDPTVLNSVSISGGAGNDAISSDFYTDIDADRTGDTITGGSGADRITLDFLDSSVTGEDRDTGIVATTTDFDTDEYMLELPQTIDCVAPQDEGEGVVATATGFEIIEAADGNFTDVILEATGAGTETILPGTIRLTGATGINGTHIAIRTPVTADT